MLLETERLRIRPISPDDWRAVREISLDFRSGPYVYYDHPMPESDIALQEVVRFFAKSGAVYSILPKESEEMIGYVCLWPKEAAFELGYCFHSAHHRKGYAFEACTALMDFLRAEHGARSFLCGTALDNLPSVRLLNRLGFVLTETGVASFYKDASGNDIRFAAGSFRKDFPSQNEHCRKDLSR